MSHGTYEPTAFFRGSRYEVATTWARHWQLIFDGWTTIGPAPHPSPFSSDQKKSLEEAYPADATPDLSGGTARWYGDSFSAGYGLPAGQSYIQLAAAEHGITTFQNRAISGSAAQSIGPMMLWSSSQWGWSEGASDLLVINGGLNDARYNDLSLAANSKWLKSLKNSVRLACALALGKERVVWNNYTRWAYAGTWNGGAYPYSTNGSTIAYTVSPGASATFSFEGDEISLVLGGYETESTCVVDFYIDDQHVRTARLFDDTVIYPGSGTTIGFKPERFTGLAPGPHTVRVTKSDLTSAALYIDCAIERSDTPPVVLINKEPDLPADVWAMYDPYDNGNTNSIKAVHKVLDDIASEFPSVRLCALPPLVPVVDFQADLIHPNALGRDKLKVAVSDALEPLGLANRVEDIASSNRTRRTLGRRQTVVSRFRPTGAFQTYIIPEGAVALEIRSGGAAGGGGSGRRGAASTVRCGGGGGGGGGFDTIQISTYGLPRTIYVWAGAGGAGGLGRVADDLSGLAGAAGQASYVVTDTSLPAGDESVYLSYAPGGSAGAGGTATAGAGGGAVASRMGLSGAGGSASASGGAGASPNNNGYGGVGQGGGAGGGLSAANAAAVGGAGWWSGLYLTSAITAPAGGANTGGAGGHGTAATLMGRFAAGPSGAGGGANLTGVGGAGGNGGLMSGGGGGGASVNGNVSGAGGKGGDGFVEITAYF